MKDENQIFEAYDDAMKELDKSYQENFQLVVEPLLKIESKEFVEVFEGYMEDGSSYNFSITDNPIATSQEDYEGEHSIDVYIDQSCGYSGDDYSGVISLKTRAGKYLNWDFAC